MNSTLTASENSGSMDGQSFGYGIGLSLGVLMMFVIITAAYYVCTQRNHTVNTLSHHIATHRFTVDTGDNSLTIRPGLDEATLSAYPQFTYAQLKQQELESNASGCSICLADYKDTDLLRMLPDCGHLFHLTCIDPWLTHHPTCPVCRTSPKQTPPVSMVTVV